MKPKLIFLFMTLLSFNAFCQNPIWIFAPKYYSNISGTISNLPSGPNPSIDYAGQEAKCSSNAIADEEGNLRLFVVDGNVYDGSGYLLGNMFYGGKDNKGRSETAIVTNPNNCNEVYIFAAGRDYSNSTSPDQMTYTVVDFSQTSSTNPTRVGEVYPSVLMPYTPAPQGKEGNVFFAVSKKLSDNSHFIFVSTPTDVRKFKLDANGITYVNSMSMPGGFGQMFVRGEMELYESSNPSADGYKYRIAVPYAREAYSSQYGSTIQTFHSVYTANLDNSGNVISGTVNIYDYLLTAERPFIRGLEFDKTGKFLFIVHNPTALYTSTIDYVNYDVADDNFPLLLAGDSDFKDSQLEFGKINGQEGLYLINSTKIGRLSIQYNTNPNLSVVSLNANYLNQGIPASYMGTENIWTDYADFKSYLLPDQIDGLDYSDFNFQYYDKLSFSAVTNATWTSTTNPLNNGTANYAYIKDELRIPKGKTVTISGMTIHFAPNARLVIENGDGTLQGGKLTLTNGTKLTSDARCGSNTWFGTEVWGNSSIAQGSLTNSQQGRLIISGTLTKPVVIENAINAVAARATSPINNANISGKYGGVIQATNAIFLNNQNDAIVTNYISGSTNNLSKFVNCTFKTNSAFNIFGLPLGNHIYLNAIQGVSITGSDFINEDFNNFSIDKQGIGINGINANYFVDKRCSLAQIPCTPDDPNTFTNLTYGIYNLSFSSTATFRSDGNLYNNNAIGIFVYGTTAPTIVRNTFKIREILSSNPIINQTSGLYMLGSTGYKIEENSFEELDNPLIINFNGNSFGIVVRNSGTADNFIYRNTFKNLKIGGQSESTNGSVQVGGNGTGLIWRCNRFNESIYSYDLSVMEGTINYHQGFVIPTTESLARLAAANNKFSLNNEPAAFTHDFFVSQNSTINNINYVHYLNDAFYDLDSYTTNRIAISNAQFNGTNLTYNSEEGCPSNFTSGQVYLKINQPESENLTTQSTLILDDLFIQLEKEQYDQNIKNLEIQSKLQEILLDTLLENKNATLEEFLSQYDDEASLKMLAELQIGEKDVESVVNSLQNEKVKFSQDFIDLLKIKAELLKSEDYFSFMNEKENQEFYVKRLSEIAENKEDVLTAHQASIILSFSKPLDLTYHFLEVEEGGEKSMKIPTSNTESKSNLIVYPNPVKNKLAINLALAENEHVSATIFSVLGNTMGTWELSNENNGIDVNHFQGGVYLIHVNNAQGENIQTLRFVKQ